LLLLGVVTPLVSLNYQKFGLQTIQEIREKKRLIFIALEKLSSLKTNLLVFEEIDGNF